jgi:hypothetical protein
LRASIQSATFFTIHPILQNGRQRGGRALSKSFCVALEGQRFAAPAFPSVSNLISDLRFALAPDAVAQFRRGVEVLQQIAELGLDPFAPLPAREEWTPYLEEKRRRMLELQEAVRETELGHLGALTVGYAETGAAGAPGRLYQMGADVAVVRHQLSRQATLAKYTISGDGVRVDGLLPFLCALEPGWGGPAHGTIIGSPRWGSRLSFAEVCSVVEVHARELPMVVMERGNGQPA